MNIIKKKEGTELLISLEGRLDTSTAPKLEKEIFDELSDVTHLVFDFEKLMYISSAGLRVLLMLYKRMNKAEGKMELCNVDENIMEVLEITGFVDFLTVR